MTKSSPASARPARRRLLRRMLFALSVPITLTSLRARTDTTAALAFKDMYAAQGVLGLELSPTIRALSGKSVHVVGYMAPPLKPDVGFFVLTRVPVALCPFCNSDADWPSDIVVVYPRGNGGWAQDGLPVAVAGILELGSKVDQATGFVSLIRIVDASVHTMK